MYNTYTYCQPMVVVNGLLHQADIFSCEQLNYPLLPKVVYKNML